MTVVKNHRAELVQAACGSRQPWTVPSVRGCSWEPGGWDGISLWSCSVTSEDE